MNDALDMALRDDPTFVRINRPDALLEAFHQARFCAVDPIVEQDTVPYCHAVVADSRPAYGQCMVEVRSCLKKWHPSWSALDRVPAVPVSGLEIGAQGLEFVCVRR